ncbi:MAG: thiamine phosphate synthase [Bacteroidaceae bacterium]|nr:thiamine phosphate synthase [Bacteroidaceae bacterium]
MKLLLLSSPHFFVEEDKILSSLFEEGLDILHLRKPDTEPVYSERLLTLMPREHHSRIITNDHFYLKEEFQLMGIHLSARNPLPPQNYNGLITRSCNSLEELAEAKRDSQYVILKDVFDSLSDPECKSKYTLEQLREAGRRGLIDRHVIAQTGISLDTIPQAADMGFGGVIVCNDLWKRFNIHSGMDYKALIAHFRQLRKATG